jgi:hypothetical protein
VGAIVGYAMLEPRWNHEMPWISIWAPIAASVVCVVAALVVA